MQYVQFASTWVNYTHTHVHVHVQKKVSEGLQTKLVRLYLQEESGEEKGCRWTDLFYVFLNFL